MKFAEGLLVVQNNMTTEVKQSRDTNHGPFSPASGIQKWNIVFDTT